MTESSTKSVALAHPALVVVSASAIQLVALGLIGLIAARVLGPADRGTMVLLVAVASFGLVLIPAGSNTAIRSILPRDQGYRWLGAYMGSIKTAAALQAVFAGILGTALITMSGAVVNWPLILAASVYAAFLIWALMLRDALFGLGFSQKAAGLDALGAFCQLCFVLILSTVPSPSASFFLGGMALGSSLQVVASIFALRGPGVVQHHRSRRVRRLLILGVPSVFVALTQAIALQGDRVILGFTHGVSAVGIYSVAATVSTLLLVLPVGVSQMLFRCLAEGSYTNAVRRLRVGSILLFGGGSFLGWLLAPSLIPLLFGLDYEASVDPARVLLLGSVGLCLVQLNVSGLQAVGMSRVAARWLVVSSCPLFLLYVALIPTWGIMGAAYGSAVGYLIMGCVMQVVWGRAVREKLR